MVKYLLVVRPYFLGGVHWGSTFRFPWFFGSHYLVIRRTNPRSVNITFLLSTLSTSMSSMNLITTTSMTESVLQNQPIQMTNLSEHLHQSWPLLRISTKYFWRFLFVHIFGCLPMGARLLHVMSFEPRNSWLLSPHDPSYDCWRSLPTSASAWWLVGRLWQMTGPLKETQYKVHSMVVFGSCKRW